MSRRCVKAASCPRLSKPTVWAAMCLNFAGPGRARARVLVSCLPIAEIVLAPLSGDLSRTESQPEIPDLIRTSDGLTAQFPMRARHHGLTAKRCSISQTSSSHMGLCMQPGEGLERIMQRMVLPIS